MQEMTNMFGEVIRQTIRLHPRIAKLVNDEVYRCNQLPRTKFQMIKSPSPTTADEVVNEILWMALRKGDITKHYTS